MQTRPTWVIEEAVRGMLPRNRLGTVMLRKLKVYAGPSTRTCRRSRQAEVSVRREQSNLDYGGVMADVTYYAGTGRRKTAIAQVRLMPGTGDVTVNGKPMAEYFPGGVLQSRVICPAQGGRRRGRSTTWW